MNRLKMPLVSVHTPRVRSSRGSCPLWPPPMAAEAADAASIRSVRGTPSYQSGKVGKSTTVLAGIASGDLGAFPKVTRRCSQVSSRSGILGIAT